MPPSRPSRPRPEASMDLTSLFRDHLRERLACLERALAATGFDALVVSSGAPFRYFGDDHDAPFQGVAHFRGYCPLEGPHHVLKLEPGRRPLLVRFAPADYWEEQVPMADAGFWAGEFDLREAPSLDAVWGRRGASPPGAPTWATPRSGPKPPAWRPTPRPWCTGWTGTAAARPTTSCSAWRRPPPWPPHGHLAAPGRLPGGSRRSGHPPRVRHRHGLPGPRAGLPLHRRPGPQGRRAALPQ